MPQPVGARRKRGTARKAEPIRTRRFAATEHPFISYEG
jgi:hypothetical protein